MGNKEMAKQIVEMLIEIIPEKLELMEIAFESEDTEEIRKISHNIKGAAASSSACKLSEIASKIEIASKQNDLDKIELLIKIIKKELENFINNIEIKSL